MTSSLCVHSFKTAANFLFEKYANENTDLTDLSCLIAELDLLYQSLFDEYKSLGDSSTSLKTLKIVKEHYESNASSKLKNLILRKTETNGINSHKLLNKA